MKRNSVSLKHFVPLFHFQTINHCLESKFPIGIDPFWANVNKLGLCLFFFFPPQKVEFLHRCWWAVKRVTVERLPVWLWSWVPAFPFSPPLPWTSYCIWRAFSLGSRKACTVLGGQRHLARGRWWEASCRLVTGPPWRLSFKERNSVSYVCPPKMKKEGRVFI